jgi:hypothetical protein
MKFGRVAGIRVLLILVVSGTALALSVVGPASSMSATPKSSRF